MQESTPSGVADGVPRGDAGASRAAVEADRPEPTEIQVVHADELGLERLQRKPIIERIDEHQIELITRTVAVAEGEQQITKAELGHFLELCALYGLDPFAREAWIAKSKTGKLLIMVGRDGLRKIVQRNGCEMRGAVIYAKDEFSVELIDNPEDAKPGEWEAHGHAQFHRVTHKQRGIGEQRGPVVGAWARSWERKTRIERGYFDAPVSEYMPANVSQYSPWSKQISTMMLGAVERQTARQATPLGGLLFDGEQYTVDERPAIGAGEGDGSEPGWSGLSDEQVADIEALLAVAQELGAPLDRATAQLKLNGRPDAVAAWLEDETARLAKHQESEGDEPPEAVAA